MEAQPKVKSCYIGVPEVFSLGHCCGFIAHAFGEHTCYLVGSSIERPDFRDVDVVLIIPDEKWKALFGSCDNGEILPFWSLMMTSISEYITKRTGLRIDFKVQSMAQANTGSHKGKKREPIGLYVDHAAPEWTGVTWGTEKLPAPVF